MLGQLEALTRAILPLTSSRSECQIMSVMLTVSVPDREAHAIEEICRATGKSQDQVVLDALRHNLFRSQLQQLRDMLTPAARAAGWFTDEDIFNDMS